jgi:hypothetical protein
VWGLSQKQSFDDLKKRLCSSLVLSLPDLQHPFEIETDASDYVVSVILTQHSHPVAYHSETLSDVVCKYPTYDKEMYSIVQACLQWRHYILWKETIIHTNHNPLQFMHTQGKLQNDAIRSGSHTYNSSTSTSSIKQEVPTELFIPSVDLRSRHSPRC